MTEIGCQTYSLRHCALEEMLAGVRKAGFHGVELWVGHGDYADGERGAARVRAAADGVGLRIQAYYVGGFVRVAVATVEARLEQAFAYARALGVDLVTGVVDRRAVPAVDALCRRTGLRFGIENHWYADFARPDDYLAVLADTSPRVGVTLDTGHLALAGGDPAHAVEALGDRLFAVHLKDVLPPTGLARWLPRRRRMQSCLLGAGQVPVEPFLAALAHGDFDGSIVVEDERPNLPLSELQASLRAGTRILRAVLRDGAAQPVAN